MNFKQKFKKGEIFLIKKSHIFPHFNSNKFIKIYHDNQFIKNLELNKCFKNVYLELKFQNGSKGLATQKI